MNNKIKTILLTLLILMTGTQAYAYDIAVKNADGVTILYNYINDGKELEVARGTYYTYQGNIVFPEEVTYMNRTRKVTSIESKAFYECIYLTSVTIPNSVTSIGSELFKSCTGLISVIIPNSVTSIGDMAFYDCNHLTSINIPNSVTSIGHWTFQGCSSLTSVTIPNSVTTIGGGAFERCSGLTSVTIPNSVTSIEWGVFSGCSGLTSVTIPNSVTNIGGSAFSRCSRLTSVTIPNNVISIGENAFNGCSRLTSVTIPKGVTSIGNGAFNGIDLPIVVSQIENPFKIAGKSSDNRTFSKNTFLNATLYVPKGTINKYKATEGWKDFLFIEEGDGSTNGVASVRSYGVMIQASEGFFNISGLEVGTPISVYNTAGQMVGSAKTASETTIVNTTLRSGEIGIVKIGDKSVKVLMK